MVLMHSARHFWACLGITALGLGSNLSVQAQVVRCTDASSGKVTYTDGKCPSTATAIEVEARKTPEQLEQERAQAAQALAQKNQRLQAEAAAAQAEALRSAQQNQARPAVSRDYARSPECARARRNLDAVLSNSGAGTYEQSLRMQAAQRQTDIDCLGPAGYAQVEGARAASAVGAGAPVVVVPAYPARPVRPVGPMGPGSQPIPTLPPEPKKFTQCNVFRCHDAQGNVYPR